MNDIQKWQCLGCGEVHATSREATLCCLDICAPLLPAIEDDDGAVGEGGPKLGEGLLSRARRPRE